MLLNISVLVLFFLTRLPETYNYHLGSHSFIKTTQLLFLLVYEDDVRPFPHPQQIIPYLCKFEVHYQDK